MTALPPHSKHPETSFAEVSSDHPIVGALDQLLQQQRRVLVTVDSEAQRRSLFFATTHRLLQRATSEHLLLLIPGLSPQQTTLGTRAQQRQAMQTSWAQRRQQALQNRLFQEVLPAEQAVGARVQLASVREVQLLVRAASEEGAFPYATLLVYEVPAEPSLVLQQVLLAVPAPCRVIGFCLCSKQVPRQPFGFQAVLDARTRVSGQ